MSAKNKAKAKPASSDRKRVVFTQGGKGGVAKTEVALSLASWYAERDLQPTMLDLDIENTEKGGLSDFYPQAKPFDIHEQGTLDEFLTACDGGSPVVLADMGAGAGKATYAWFENAADIAQSLGVRFTAIGVTTNEASSVQAILRWAGHLQDSVDYLIVLNEMRRPRCPFEYWYDEPRVQEFVKALKPRVMRMDSRVEEFQAELRNQSLTLQDVATGNVTDPFFRLTKNKVRAIQYQRTLFGGFDEAADILLP
ncbi:MAG: hypothetical protein R3F11_20785 [Verrucomicrobiales bacterium]